MSPPPRPKGECRAAKPAGTPVTPLMTVSLDRAAHGRTGDKGNRSNISVIAWHPALWDTLVAQVTEEAVALQFAHRRPARVTRHLLPQLQAMNFVLDEVLDGGVNDALNLDSHGKALSFLLLDMPIRISADLAVHLAGRDADDRNPEPSDNPPEIPR